MGRVVDFLERPEEFWHRVLPIALARLINDTSDPIEFDLSENHDFVKALARARRGITPTRWARLLKKLVPVFWTGCLGGDPWNPRVLVNGGVAIRNFHRVVSLDLDYGISVSGVRPAQIRREVQTVLRRAAAAQDFDVVLMHHGPKGVVFSQTLPADWTFYGQSLLFSAAVHVKGLGVLGAAEGDEQNQIAIRLFHDTICMYPTSRDTDEADTVIERFVAARCDLDWTFPMTALLNPANARAELLEPIHQGLDDDFAECDVPAALRKDFRVLMTSDEPNSWASQLFDLLNRFPPLFGREPLRPPLAGPRATWVPRRLRSSVYSLETRPAEPMVSRFVSSRGIQKAKLATAPGSQRIQTVSVPFRNLVEARDLAVALSKRFGRVWLTVPHLGLDHREGGGAGKGNGAWFGFGRRHGVLTVGCKDNTRPN